MRHRLSPAVLTHIAAYCVFLAAALVITYPLVTVFSTRFAGHPFGDSYELARHIWWIRHALQTGQPIIHQPLLAYPAGLDGAILWSYPLQSFPAWLFAFVMPLPAAYNLMVVLRLAANGWSAYWLARYLTGGHTLPALGAGLVFMTYPTMQGHLAAGHPGLLALGSFPLYAYMLFRIRDTLERRYVILAALLFATSQWGSTQLLIFTTAPVTILFALALAHRRDGRALRRVGAAVALGGALSLVFALPLLASTTNSPVRLETGAVDYSADLLAVIAPSFMHPLFRDNPISARVLGIDPFEGAAYVGMIASGLALVGVVAQRAARWWLVVGLVAWVCSLGPLLRVFYEPVIATIDGYSTYVPLPWSAFASLPLINITRAPGRFNFAVALAAAIMAAYGLAWLRTKLPANAARIALLLLPPLIVVEVQFWWTPSATLPDLPTIPGIVPEPIAALSSADTVRAVFDLPWNHLLAAKAGMWLQTGHQRPLIAGHMTRQTPVNPAMLTILQDTLDPALLDSAGVDVVILHKDWDDEAGDTETFTRERLGEPFYEDEQYAAFNVPEPGAMPALIAMPALDGDLIHRADSYLYVSSPRMVTLTATLEADGRDLILLVDDMPVERVTISGDDRLSIPLDVSAGYHTLTLALDPPCPRRHDLTLECRAVALRDLTLDDVPD